IALFDKPAYWDRKPVETKVPMDRAKFEEQARELQIAIDELNKRIITRSKVWLKKHQPDDAERTKAQLQTLKRQDTKERDEKVSQLHELRARLKNWGADDRDCNVVTTWERVPVFLKEVFSGTMYVELAMEFKYVDDKEKKVGGIHTHTTTRPVYEIIETPELYTLDAYKKNVPMPEWTKWENQVLLMAIHYNMVHPTPEALRKHPWLRRWEPEPDD